MIAPGEDEVKHVVQFSPSRLHALTWLLENYTLLTP